jgi:hypothetical protein
MKKKWFKKLIGGISFTAALFIFQACYGTPQDIPELDIKVTGKVLSAEDGSPLAYISVRDNDLGGYQITDENGEFHYYRDYADSIMLNFRDEATNQPNLYASKDTVIHNVFDDVHFEIKLNAK